MSATEQMAAMLNELMGPKRNADFGDNNEPDFNEPEVCKDFLIAFCPNDMFRNTKADLGYCSKVHDPALRTKYRQSSRFEKMGFEEDFLNKIRRLDDEVRRKIDKNERRLAVTQPVAVVPTTSEEGEVETDAQRRQKELVAEQQSSLSVKIGECMDKAEKLGALGKVEEAKEAVRQAEKFKLERTALDRLLAQSANATTNPIEDLANQLSKPMEVCQVCGCFMLVNDVQQRIDDHYAGKQHMAYAKIRGTIDEMDKRKEEKRKERAERELTLEKEKRERDKKEKDERVRKDDKDRDRRRDDRDRDRSGRDRDRDRGSRHRHEDNRSRDYDRRNEGHRDRRNDRGRDRDRSRR